MSKLGKAINKYLSDNGHNSVSAGVVKCRNATSLPMYICIDPSENIASIVTYQKQEDVKNWERVDSDSLHKEYEKDAIPILKDFIKNNEDIYPLDNPELQYHHIDIVPNENGCALVRAHWNIQNYDEVLSTRRSPSEEKIYQDIAIGNNIDKYQKQAEKFALQGKEEAASSLQHVIDTYLAVNKYRNIKDWIEKNPDKCGLKENKSTKEAIANTVKLGAKAPLQTKPTPQKDTR